MQQRVIEVFSAGCTVCEEAVARVRALACPSCDVRVLDMRDSAVAKQAADIGVLSVPAVAVDGKLADCCSARGPDEAALRAAGLGRPLA
ncbi:MAG: thioredoxin family protein [Rhodospirillales bacterium]